MSSLGSPTIGYEDKAAMLEEDKRQKRLKLKQLQKEIEEIDKSDGK